MGGIKMVVAVALLLVTIAAGYVVYDWQKTKQYAQHLEVQLKLKQKIKQDNIKFQKELDEKLRLAREAQKELDRLRKAFEREIKE